MALAHSERYSALRVAKMSQKEIINQKKSLSDILIEYKIKGKPLNKVVRPRNIKQI